MAHGFDEEPIVIYSKIGAKGFETRKVEQFRDGTSTFANELRGQWEYLALGSCSSFLGGEQRAV